MKKGTANEPPSNTAIAQTGLPEYELIVIESPFPAEHHYSLPLPTGIILLIFWT